MSTKQATGNSRPAKPAVDEKDIIGLGQVFGRDSAGLPVLIVLFLGLALTTDSFLTGTNLDNLGRQISIFAIIAIGQLLVILTACIDLSTGSVVGLSGVIAAIVVHDTTGGLPVVLGVLAALAAGAVVGVVNGSLVSLLGMPPFIVTLGALGIARGVALLLTDGRTIQPLPEGFNEIARGEILGISNLVYLTVVIAAVVAFALRRTVWGRYVYAVGSNPVSARLTGVPVTKVLLSVYTLAGAISALGGILLAARLGNGVPTAGTGYELQAIAACVIGGASLFGARGTAIGALIGAVIVGVLNNGGTLLGVDPFWLQVAIGVLILVAVGLDQLPSRAHTRRGR